MHSEKASAPVQNKCIGRTMGSELSGTSKLQCQITSAELLRTSVHHSSVEVPQIYQLSVHHKIARGINLRAYIHHRLSKHIDS